MNWFSAVWTRRAQRRQASAWHFTTLTLHHTLQAHPPDFVGISRVQFKPRLCEGGRVSCGSDLVGKLERLSALYEMTRAALQRRSGIFNTSCQRVAGAELTKRHLETHPFVPAKQEPLLASSRGGQTFRTGGSQWLLEFERGRRAAAAVFRWPTSCWGTDHFSWFSIGIQPLWHLIVSGCLLRWLLKL